MSDRCSTVPTATLYSTALQTAQVTRTVTAVSTLPDGEVTQVLSLDIDQNVETVSAPTTTLFSTQCRSAVTRQSMRTTQMTVEESSTQAGGNVVVQTVVRTITSAEIVVETQTLAPVAQPSQDLQITTTHHHTNAGAIAGGIVGAVVALGLLAAGLWYARKRRRNAHATRNLDDFFHNPNGAAWDDKNSGSADGGAAIVSASTGRSGTLRSFSRRSLGGVLNLEKETRSSAERENEHWAALTLIDSAQLGEEGMQHQQQQQQQRSDSPPTYGRSQSRQSMQSIGRPLSFHSMSMSYVNANEDQASEGVEESAIGISRRSIGQDSMLTTDPMLLLRNDSDRSSASAMSPDGAKANASFADVVPPTAASIITPPISPISMYGSPQLREMPLYEGVALESMVVTGGRPTIMRGAHLSMGSGMLANRMTGDANGSSGEDLHPSVVAKQRSWSTSSFNMPDRPKSALGLSGRQHPLVLTPQYHSPPQSPTMAHAGGVGPLRGRASLNGGAAQYPHLVQRQSMHQQQQQRSPPLSPRQYALSHAAPNNSPGSGGSSPGAGVFPPSQYTHLDVHKTPEERAEDRRHAFATVSGASIGRSSSNEFARGTVQQQQHRHRSLSGELLLRITNADTLAE